MIKTTRNQGCFGLVSFANGLVGAASFNASPKCKLSLDPCRSWRSCDISKHQILGNNSQNTLHMENKKT